MPPIFPGQGVALDPRRSATFVPGYHPLSGLPQVPASDPILPQPLKQESMFNNACEQVRSSLSTLVDQVRQQMLDRVDSVYVSMKGDYMRVIGGVNVGHSIMPREERAVRCEVDDAITDADGAFQKIVASELDEPREAREDAEGDVVKCDEEEMDVDDGFETARESDSEAEEEAEDGTTADLEGKAVGDDADSTTDDEL